MGDGSGTLERLILIIGRSGVGKTTAGAFLAERLGGAVYEASAAFRELAAERGVSALDSAAALAFLQANGMASVAERIHRKILSDPAPCAIVTGLRTREEVGYLTKRVRPNVRLQILAIEAPDAVRLTRLAARGRAGAALSPEALGLFDAVEAQFGLTPVAAGIADTMIQNDGALPSFRKSLLKAVGVDDARALSPKGPVGL